MTDHTRQLPEIVAAVDLGSNSFHMLVARTGQGTPVVVDRLREMVQLASGLDEHGRLSGQARERAIECLKRFGQRVSHMPAESVRAVGTNTLRTAREAEEFLAEAEQALGHPIETISGIEEARLIFLGVTQTLPEPETRRLVVDIGGGSTELIDGQGLQPLDMESLYMGSITMSRAHFADGVLNAKNWNRARTAALQELAPVRERFRGSPWQEAVGASGTVRAVDNLVRRYGWSEDGVTPESLGRLRDALLKAGKTGRLKLEGLNPARRPYIAGGAVILAAVIESLGIERLRRSSGALREGLVYDLIGRIREQDIRGRSVEALSRRYHVDWKQAERVESTALRLLVQVAEGWRLDPKSSRQMLSWASRLHEIGLDVAHDHYHRHGEYIVANTDMPGFSRDEQGQLAALVRAHRRKFPRSLLRSLPRGRARPAERQAVLLRLATVLHRSRSPEPPPDARLKASKRSLQLKFPPGWLEGQPLTRANLETEVSYLAAGGYSLEFE